MTKKIKTIGKTSEKIGNTTVTGEGALVDYDTSDDVAIRDYVTGKGYSGIVHWAGDTPTVAGVKIPTTEIKNGISYAKKDDVDKVLNGLDERIGIRDAQQMRDAKFKKAEDDAFDKVINRKEFEYNPDDDAVYQAYKKQYERQAEDMFRKILNENNASLTGASGAVLSEAMTARDNELDKITDIIPDLYENAFNRYVKENEMRNSELATITDMANDYYDRIYQSNNDIIKRMTDAGNVEREERQRQLDNERDATKDIYENALNEIELRYKEDIIKSDLDKTQTASEKTAMDNAITRGFFIESDESKLPWLRSFRNADGSYSISPSLASLRYEYDTAHERERAKLNAKLGR